MLKSYFTNDLIEAGCDEAGRGCLAGPVVAAAVILSKEFKNVKLNDSKKLNKKQREELEVVVKEHSEAYAIGEVWNEEIDEINILNASFLAMHRAIEKLKTVPQLLLIDGNRFKSYKNINHECIIKGDGKYASIAAASVLAKTHRDKLMEELSIKHPHYGWEKNAGYPTAKHRDGIKAYGTTPYHRMSFRLLPDQLELF